MFMSLQRVNLSYYRRAGPIKSLADKKVFRLTKWTTSYFIIVLMRILSEVSKFMSLFAHRIT